MDTKPFMYRVIKIEGDSPYLGYYVAFGEYKGHHFRCFSKDASEAEDCIKSILSGHGVPKSFDMARVSLDSYTSLGSYPLAYLVEDPQNACVLCPTCAAAEVLEGDGVGKMEAFINYEDPEKLCEDCGARIPSAYAEDDSREGEV